MKGVLALPWAGIEVGIFGQAFHCLPIERSFPLLPPTLFILHLTQALSWVVCKCGELWILQGVNAFILAQMVGKKDASKI